MQTKRISWEEVRSIVAKNKEQGDKAVIEGAMVALKNGPMPVDIDPLRPFAMQVRHSKEGQDAEADWCLHPWRFHDLASASKAAKDLRKLDLRLEIRIAKAAGN
jgi:hypothetical protein